MGAGCLLQEADRGHDEARHAEGALEALLLDHALLHRMERAVGRGQALDRLDASSLRTECVSTEQP